MTARFPLIVAAAGVLAAILVGGAYAQREAKQSQEDAQMRLKKVTPVILVEAIEPCIEFWTERLGFTVTAEVPHEEKLGFVMMAHGDGGPEVMLQSRASVEADEAALAAGPFAKDGVGLFIEVDGPLDPWVKKLEGCEVVVERRKTFYGADEYGVRAPGGIVVMLASFGGADEGESQE